jgi:hypothetical protein
MDAQFIAFVSLFCTVALGGGGVVWKLTRVETAIRDKIGSETKILDDKLGLPPEVLTMLFGLGVMQVLLVQPKGVVEDLRKLGLLIGRKTGLVRRPPAVVPAQGTAA